MKNQRAKLPTIEVFRASVDSLLDSISPTGQDGQLEIYCHVDLEKRQKINGAPWYTIVPRNFTRNLIVSLGEEGAVEPKFSASEIAALQPVYQNEDYELVRVDGFSNVDERERKIPKGYAMRVSVAHQLYSGFTTQSLTGEKGQAITIINNAHRIIELGCASDLEYGVTDRSFVDNMLSLQAALSSQTIKKIMCDSSDFTLNFQNPTGGMGLGFWYPNICN